MNQTMLRAALALSLTSFAAACSDSNDPVALGNKLNEQKRAQLATLDKLYAEYGQGDLASRSRGRLLDRAEAGGRAWDGIFLHRIRFEGVVGRSTWRLGRHYTHPCGVETEQSSADEFVAGAGG